MVKTRSQKPAPQPRSTSRRQGFSNEVSMLLNGAFFHNPNFSAGRPEPKRASKRPRITEAVQEEADAVNQQLVPAVVGELAQVTATLAFERLRSAQLEGELAQVTAALALERRRSAKQEKTLNSRMSLLKMVSGRVPRAHLASVLQNMLPAELISSFLGIREVLMLKIASKSLAKILTGRPELYRDADVYQFNSRYPEQHTLQFCKVLLLERAALRNLRLIFSVDEWCVPRSVLLACNLNSLEALSLKRWGSLSVARNGFLSKLSSQLRGQVVDMTSGSDPESGLNTTIMIEKCDRIITTLERATTSSSRSVLEVLMGCKNLRSIDIPLSDQLIRAQDLHILESMPFLSSLELCLAEEINVMDGSTINFSLDVSQVKSLFSDLFPAIKSLKVLKTFVLRDGGNGNSGLARSPEIGFTDFSRFCHPGLMLLESNSLEIVDFSQMEKGFRMEGLKCPKLKQLAGVGRGYFAPFYDKSQLPHDGTVFNPSGVNYQGEHHVFGSVWLTEERRFRFSPVILPRDCVVEGQCFDFH